MELLYCYHNANNSMKKIVAFIHAELQGNNLGLIPLPHPAPINSQIPDFKMFPWKMYKYSTTCTLILLENFLNMFKK